MAGIIGNGVSLRGLYNQDKAFSWNITGTINKATDIGKVVSQDVTAANSAKLIVADESILGVLASYEDRVQEGVKVGTVYHDGAFSVPYTGTLAIGDQVCGSATPGAVKKATAALTTGYGRKPAIVVEIDAGAGTCVIAFV